MPQRKNPASAVVEFFETASIETAQTVLAICKGVVARRQPTKAKPRTRAPRASADESAEG